MQLSVIIVNYNVRYFLEQALFSVRRASQGLEVEVFVVDNASSDDSVEMVKEKFPEVKLIANQDNPGFSIANNQAIAISKGKYILLLNPDTVVAEDTFSKCINFMDQHPEVGGLGVKMVDGSGQFLPESKRGFPSPWVAFCKATGLSGFFKNSKTFNGYHLGYLSNNESYPVDVLSGAYMFMSRKALEKSGYLDETFFMYGEDIDLSYRIKKAGYENYYLAETSIIHYKGESTKKGSLNYVKAFYQAMIIFARKHFTGQKARLFIFMLQIAIYLKAFLTLMGNFLKAVKLPFLDFLIMLSGMLLLPTFWANYYFRNPGYFDQAEFYFVNIPLYIFLWMGGIFLSGGYDLPISVRRTVRGIVAGSVVLAAIYGFLPLEYRFSRALVILGAIWALLGSSGIRVLLHFLQYNNFNIGESQTRNLAIIGSQQESERALKLLQKAGARKNYLGLISAEGTFDESLFIGNTDGLSELTALFKIEEIIFCSKDISHKQILEIMQLLKGKVNFKILPEAVEGIIGSHSKNERGELYTLEVDFEIAKPSNRRNKRTLDVILSFPLLILSPIYLITRKKAFHPGHVWQVLTGQSTWVGYIQPGSAISKLPKIRKGIFNQTDAFKRNLSEATCQRLDFQYAKDYTVSRDLEVFWKAMFG
ncbi:MAG: glycosyltransferase [Saprospiraceae bacterium]